MYSEKIERDAFHAGELIANPVLREVLDEMEKDAIERLVNCETSDAYNVLKAQTLVASTREFRAKLVNKVNALKNKHRAEENKQVSPMGENL